MLKGKGVYLKVDGLINYIKIKYKHEKNRRPRHWEYMFLWDGQIFVIKNIIKKTNFTNLLNL